MAPGSSPADGLAELRAAISAARSAFSAVKTQLALIAPELPKPVARFQALIRAAGVGEVDASEVTQVRAATVDLVANIRELSRLYAVAAERADELLAAAAKARATALN